MSRPPLIGLLSLWLVAGCSEPSGPFAPGEAALEFFPMVEGARWLYRVDLGIGETELEVVARGLRDVQGLDGPVFIMDEINRGQSFGMARLAPTGYVIAGGRIRRYTGLDYTESGEIQLLGGEDAAILLPHHVRGSHTWSEETRMFELPEGGGGQARFEGHTEMLAALEVPAGRFEDVLLVRTLYWDPDIDSAGPLMSYEDYYARGVGLLRSVTRNEQDASAQMVEQRLLHFSFPQPESVGNPPERGSNLRQ